MTCRPIVGSVQFNPTTFPCAGTAVWDSRDAFNPLYDVPDGPPAEGAGCGQSVSPVYGALDDIAGEQSTTFVLLSTLVGKLESVLVERLGGEDSENTPACPTPLLMALESRRRTASDINEGLRSIIDRIVL